MIAVEDAFGLNAPDVPPPFVANALIVNPSYFSDCERDEKGRCVAGSEGRDQSKPDKGVEKVLASFTSGNSFEFGLPDQFGPEAGFGKMDQVIKYVERGGAVSPLTQKFVDKFHAALDARPDYQGTVYRGMAVSDDVLQQLVESKEVKFGETSSTSPLREQAEGYLKGGLFPSELKKNSVLLTIKVKTAKHTGREAVIRRGTSFRVVSSRRDGGVTHFELTENELVVNPSFFEDCIRDERGRCTSGGGAAPAGTSSPGVRGFDIGPAHPEAQARVAKAHAEAAKLPKAAMDKAVNFATSMYKNMEAKYGSKWAKAIVTTALISLPTPVTTGAILSMVGLARLTTKLRTGKWTLLPSAPAANQGELDRESFEELVRQLIEEMLAALEGPVANQRWAFRSDPDKVKAFQLWLRSRLRELLVGRTEEELWAKFVEEGMKKGAGRAFDDVNKELPKGTKEQLDFYQGTRQQFLADSFRQPVAVAKVKLLAGRAFDDLQGITEQMSRAMSRTLTEGLVKGESPREIARDLKVPADSYKGRALNIARTEIVRAHAEGQLIALEDLGVTELGVQVEWHTSGLGITKKGNPSPCPKCEAMSKRRNKGGVGIYIIEEATGLIPFHPS